MQKLIAIFGFAAVVLIMLSSDVAAVMRQSLFEKASSTVEALVFVRNQINDRYQIYLNTESQLAEITNKKLPPLQFKINTLREQIKAFDENIRLAEINISITQQNIKSVQLELADWQDLAEIREVELVRSQRLLTEFIRLAYAEAAQYTDWRTGEVSALKFLFTDNTLAAVEARQSYLAVLQNASADLVADLQVKQSKYDEVRAQLLVKRGEFVIAQQKLSARKKQLADLQGAKKRLLAETRGEERGYQTLMAAGRKEQAATLLEIKTLKQNLGVIDSKLITFKSELGEEEFQKLLASQAIASVSGITFPGRVPQLIWPANPARGITSTYLDSEYEEFFGVPHYAIDYRLPQGSPVIAAAPGIVYKAKDNQFGYSYIMLAHTNGLTTLYGHISQIFVQEGEPLQAGDMIGLSGGMPGTRGSGYLTTGPHLHLEVLKNGNHADPLDFLPLEQLRLDDIPKRFLSEAKSAVE